jgi:diguanylate cyclase (GGDEF)-like protein
VGTRDRATGSALFQLQIDEYQPLIDRHGQAAADSVIKRISERIILQLRDQDNITLLGDYIFALCLGPSRHTDLEVCIQMAGHLQTAIEELVSVNGVSVYVTTSIGFCLCSRSPGISGANWMLAASIALLEAEKRRPSTIRAFYKRNAARDAGACCIARRCSEHSGNGANNPLIIKKCPKILIKSPALRHWPAGITLSEV